MPTIETRKYKIIKQISALNNELVIQELENFIKNITLQLNSSNLIKPLKKNLTIGEMIEDQNYEGLNRERFDKLVQEIDLKESLTQLIEMI